MRVVPCDQVGVRLQVEILVEKRPLEAEFVVGRRVRLEDLCTRRDDFAAIVAETVGSAAAEAFRDRQVAEGGIGEAVGGVQLEDGLTRVLAARYVVVDTEKARVVADGLPGLVLPVEETCAERQIQALG